MPASATSSVWPSGWRLGDQLRADDVGAAALVLDHDLLAPGLGQPLADRARHHVAHAAGRRRHHDGDGLGRIGLRLRRAWRRAGKPSESSAPNHFVMIAPICRPRPVRCP